MAWRNSETGFGFVSRLIHWAMALGILGMLVLGTVIADMEVSLSNLWLFGLHKTIGITLLGLVVLRVVWHRITPPPAPVGVVPEWQLALARWVHRLFYGLLLAIPLAGWVASSATGIDVVFADRWVLPALAPVSETWEKAGFAVHGLLTKLLFGLIVLHVAGALKRALTGDGTLRRMIWG